MTATFLDPGLADGSVEQCIRYEYTAPVRNLRQRLMVVPPRQHGRQHRVDWSVDVRGAEAERVKTGNDSFGNVQIDIVVPEVTSWVEFEVRTTISFRSDEIAVRVPTDARYSLHTVLTAADDAIAALVDGCHREPDLICARVHRALTYGHGVTGVRTTAADALSGRRGVCQDYAHLMVAACRFVGLPARYVSGHLAGEGGSHAWVEVLREPCHDRETWIAEAWDPTHDRRTDDRYITIASGRDYSDVAPMSGTFEGCGRGSLTVHKRARTRTLG